MILKLPLILAANSFGSGYWCCSYYWRRLLVQLLLGLLVLLWLLLQADAGVNYS
jgi:hypothetical protein